MKFKKERIEVVIAAAMMIPVLMGIISAKDLIVQILTFIVFLEVIRTVINFISEGDITGIKIRYLVDGAIAYVLRELLIALTDTHHIFSEKEQEVYLLLITGIVLIVMRVIAIKFSPSRP